VRILPLTNEAADAAEFLNNLVPVLWEQVDLTTVLRDLLIEAPLCQSAYAQRYYDPRVNNHLGGYRIISRDPFQCFPDPNCNGDIRHNSDFFITAEEMPLARVRHYYPDEAEDLRGGTSDKSDERRKTRFGTLLRSIVTPDVFRMVGSTTEFWCGDDVYYVGDEISKQKVVVKTMYLRDDWANTQFKFMRKYHNENRKLVNENINTKWRIITWAGDVKLYDGNSRFYDAELPIHQFKTQSMPHATFGPNECASLIPLQDTYNEVLSMILDQIDRTIDPRTFYAPKAGVQKTNLSNIFRKLVAVQGRASDAVHIDRPNLLGNEVTFVLQEIPHIMQAIIAQPEILQGVRPEGVRSGKALEQLAYQAMPRTNKKLLRFEESIKVLVEKMIIDYMAGIGAFGRRQLEGEWVDIYPSDFLEAAVGVEVQPGSSMGTYADEKIQKIAALANSIQGIDPRLQQIILANSGISELQDMAKEYVPSIAPSPEGGGETGGVNIPLNQGAGYG
jgi:hypothetical protein